MVDARALLCKTKFGKIETLQFEVMSRFLFATLYLSEMVNDKSETVNINDKSADNLILACSRVTSFKSFVAGATEGCISTMCEDWVFSPKALEKSIELLDKLREQVISDWGGKCEELFTKLEELRPPNALVETMELCKDPTSLEALAQPVDKLIKSGAMKDTLMRKHTQELHHIIYYI